LDESLKLDNKYITDMQTEVRNGDLEQYNGYDEAYYTALISIN